MLCDVYIHQNTCYPKTCTIFNTFVKVLKLKKDCQYSMIKLIIKVIARVSQQYSFPVSIL